MGMSEEEIQRWRDVLLTAPSDDARATILNQLRVQNRKQFLELCRGLAAHPPPSTQDLGLRMLGYHGDPDDDEADAIARAHLDDPALLKAALLALGAVAIPSTFPILLASAEDGHYLALRSATKQARTLEQRRQVLQLARRQIMSNDLQMRVQAVWALRQLSTAEEEERLLLEAARRFPDELIFAALRHATPGVLPALRTLLAQFPTGSAQYNDVTDAIQAIQTSYPDAT